MHIPNSYEETRVEVLHLLMKKCPLGILIVNGTDGVEAHHRAMRGIVGIDLSLSRILGQWKVSQNRSIPDRRGVAAGLRNETDPVAHLTAKAVEEAIA